MHTTFVSQAIVGRSRVSTSFAVLAILVTSAAAQRGGSYSGGGLTSVGTPVSLCPAGQVVHDVRSRDWEIASYGTSDFGGSLGAQASLTRSFVTRPFCSDTPSNCSAEASIDAEIQIFGHVLEAAALGLTAENDPYVLSAAGAAPIAGYEPIATAFLRLAGSTVWNPSYSAPSFDQHWTLNLGPYDTPHFSAVFVLYVVPVTVSAWAGAAATADLHAYLDFAGLAAGLSGSASASVHGIAQAGVGIPNASAGVAANLRFGSPSLSGEIHANHVDGLGGSLEVCSTSIRLALQVYAQLRVRLFFKWVSGYWTRDIVSWTRPAECETLTF